MARYHAILFERNDVADTQGGAAVVGGMLIGALSAGVFADKLIQNIAYHLHVLVYRTDKIGLDLFPVVLPRMTDGQFRRVRKLIRCLCANCDSGNCLLLDNGFDPCICPQLLTSAVVCKYFRIAVLPADLELYAEMGGDLRGRKRCRTCGRKFITNTLNGGEQRGVWISRFLQFQDMEDLSRKAVVQLIQSIYVMGKKKLCIKFNYDDEYQEAVAALALTEQRKAG